jgi:hypothetical protein
MKYSARLFTCVGEVLGTFFVSGMMGVGRELERIQRRRWA